jgi:hypothetical protein
MAKFKEEYGSELPELDLGGGYAIAYLPDEITVEPEDVLPALSEVVKRECAAAGLGLPLISIEPGDRAIVPNFGRCYKDQDNFHVTYEVEIVEVSVDKVKVKSIDFASTDTIAKDPKRKQGILDFLDGEWLSKKDIELVVDDQMRRDKKLNQILS